MNPVLAGLGMFVTIAVGAYAGTWIGKRLPQHHLSDSSKDMVKVGAAFLATLAALVLGLILSAAKNSFDMKAEEVEHAAAKIIMLDQALRQLGQQALPVRDALRATVEAKRNLTWVDAEVRSVRADAMQGMATSPPITKVRTMISALHPADDEQSAMRAQALHLVDDLTQTRWLLIEQSTELSSAPLILVLAVWLATISGCLGIYAPRNGTVTAVALLCAVSVAVAVFLILELYDPYGGFVKISDAPINTAIGFLNQR